MKLLIVDDEGDAVEGMEFYFSARGHEVLTARGGHEALALVKHCKPRLMLLDLKMNGMSGFDILKRVREMDLTLVTVVVTGLGEDGLEAQCRQLGALKVVHKPVRVEDLEEIVNEIEKRGI